MEGIKKIKEIAKHLKAEGITVNVIYKETQAFRVGKEAKPGLLGIFGDVEVLDMKKTVEIFNVLF